MLQLHDELVYEVRSDDGRPPAASVRVVRECMERRFASELKVPLIVNVTCGERFGTMAPLSAGDDVARDEVLRV